MSTDNDAFFYDDEEEQPVVAKTVKRRKKAPVDVAPAMIKLQLEEVDNMAPTGQFFGLNGVGYNLRPGEPAIVPVGILNILNDAIMSVPILNADATVSGYRDRLRFPYRILS